LLCGWGKRCLRRDDAEAWVLRGSHNCQLAGFRKARQAGSMNLINKGFAGEHGTCSQLPARAAGFAWTHPILKSLRLHITATSFHHCCSLFSQPCLLIAVATSHCSCPSLAQQHPLIIAATHPSALRHFSKRNLLIVFSIMACCQCCLQCPRSGCKDEMKY